MRLQRCDIARIASTLLLVPAICVTSWGGSNHVICISDTDGSNFEVVVEEPAPGMLQCGSPSWSPDGKMIAFDATTEQPDYSISRLYVVHVDGPHKGTVADLGHGVIPTWSPDSKEIAFMLNGGNPDGLPHGIWITNTEGTETRWVGQGGSPKWSPRGDTIAVCSFGRRRTIHLLDVANGERRALFGDPEMGSKSRLTWSPDGRRLAFAPAQPMGVELFWLVDVTQPAPTPVPLGAAPAVPGYPAEWGMPVLSPDGKQVVFQMFPNAKRGPDLYLMSVDNPGLPQKIEHRETLESGAASWSPDGKRIVFASVLVENDDE